MGEQVTEKELFTREEIADKLQRYKGGLAAAKANQEKLVANLEELNGVIERTAGAIVALEDLLDPTEGEPKPPTAE